MMGAINGAGDCNPSIWSLQTFSRSLRCLSFYFSFMLVLLSPLPIERYIPSVLDTQLLIHLIHIQNKADLQCKCKILSSIQLKSCYNSENACFHTRHFLIKSIFNFTCDQAEIRSFPNISIL